MKTFEMFKQEVKDMGGIWSGGDVRFTQFMDGYGAEYHPYRSRHSEEDCVITYNTTKETWKHIGPEEWHMQYIEAMKEIYGEQ